MKKILNKNKFNYCCIALISLLIITFGIKQFNIYYENMSIKEIEKNATKISSKDIDSENKLVLVNGKLKYNSEYLTDNLFNISIETSRLYRNVEVYQWNEYTEKNKDGKTIYKYSKGWYDKRIKSKNFKKKNKSNPKKFIYKKEYFNQDQIMVGNFELSEEQIENIPCNMRLKLGTNIIIPDGFIIYDNYLINSKDPENPEIGDYRISYYYNTWSDVTILALKNDDSFEDYITKKGEKINIITAGKLDLQQMKGTILSETKKQK